MVFNVGLLIRVHNQYFFVLFLNQTYVLGAQKNGYEMDTTQFAHSMKRLLILFLSAVIYLTALVLNVTLQTQCYSTGTALH